MIIPTHLLNNLRDLVHHLDRIDQVTTYKAASMQAGFDGPKDPKLRMALGTLFREDIAQGIVPPRVRRVVNAKTGKPGRGYHQLTTALVTTN